MIAEQRCICAQQVLAREPDRGVLYTSIMLLYRSPWPDKASSRTFDIYLFPHNRMSSMVAVYVSVNHRELYLLTAVGEVLKVTSLFSSKGSA